MAGEEAGDESQTAFDNGEMAGEEEAKDESQAVFDNLVQKAKILELQMMSSQTTVPVQ